VRLDGRGIVTVDERCRTTDPVIYAVGDVTGEPMLAHRASRQGKVAGEGDRGRPVAYDNVAVPQSSSPIRKSRGAAHGGAGRA